MILVIDDEAQILTALSRGPARVGHEVGVARTAEDGLSTAPSRAPDLVLLDLKLPDLDGIEVVKRLRSWTGIPILLLSGNGTERARVAALDAGADDFIDKPFSMDELRARVNAALRRSTGTTGRSHEHPVALVADGLVADVVSLVLVEHERAWTLASTVGDTFEVPPPPGAGRRRGARRRGPGRVGHLDVRCRDRSSGARRPSAAVHDGGPGGARAVR